jgi:hypothetical protein
MMHLYEYAIIRLVPRVERQEFVNVGVIVFAKDLNCIEIKITNDLSKALVLHPLLDLAAVEHHLQAYAQIANAAQPLSPISAYDTASRFRWLTAQRSTLIQSSPVHSGYAEDMRKCLANIYEEMVG